jgi:hypothetical protein
VDSYQGQSLYASAQDVVLPNGWHVNASFSEISGTNLRHGRGYLSLDVWTTYPCWGEVCEAHSWASAELSPNQIETDRSLRTASVRDVSVELVDPAVWLPNPLPEAEPWPEDPGTGGEDPGAGEVEPWTGEGPGAGEEEPWTGEGPGAGEEEPWTGEDPGAGGEDPDAPTPVEPEPMTLTLSLTFEGVGPIDRTASHQTICGDGGRECQSIRVASSRAAVGHLVLGDQSGDVTVGGLFFGRDVDAAAPKFDEF